MKHARMLSNAVVAAGLLACLPPIPHARASEAEFRCLLPGVQCEACRLSIVGELKMNPAIVEVHFEGADRKELVITHRTGITPESLRQTLVRLGYIAKSSAGTPEKNTAHEKCVCPAENPPKPVAP